MANLHFLEFFQKYNGKLVDVDGFPKNNLYQCMDLFHVYHMECLDLTDRTILAAPTAKDVFLRFPNLKGSQYFKKTVNMPWNAPKQGDIIFFKEPFGPYLEAVNGKQVLKYAGHVAIVNTANVRKFTSFEQNMPPDKRCRLAEHDYKGVLGWLSFRGK